MNDAAQLIGTLLRVAGFDGLAIETQQAIATHALRCRYEAGQVIYLEGEPAESLYILETGWVKATRMTREGREQAMMFLRPVELFGDIAVFAGSIYPGTVTALETVQVWKIPARTMLDLIPR